MKTISQQFNEIKYLVKELDEKIREIEKNPKIELVDEIDLSDINHDCKLQDKGFCKCKHEKS